RLGGIGLAWAGEHLDLRAEVDESDLSGEADVGAAAPGWIRVPVREELRAEGGDEELVLQRHVERVALEADRVGLHCLGAGQRVEDILGEVAAGGLRQVDAAFAVRRGVRGQDRRAGVIWIGY